jgi:hypothetical protein
MVTALISHVITARPSLQSFARPSVLHQSPLVNACERLMTKLLPARPLAGARPAQANERIAA